MPHFPKPWFRAARGVWVVQIAGVQHNLGTDREAAYQRYHELMRTPVKKSVGSQSLVAIVDRFLDWTHQHRSAVTYEWYRWRLQMFVQTVDSSLAVPDLKHYHLDEWLNQHPNWSNGTKHGIARAVQRALRWATRKGYIDRSPISDYEKARPGKRTVVISPIQFETILGFVRNPRFRDLLVVGWETGCRPQELLNVEARHVDLANSRWVFPASESKGEQSPRVVYLPEPALKITERLMKIHRRGPLFRNTSGKPWTTDATNCCFTALRNRMGKAEMKRKKLNVSQAEVQELIPNLNPTIKNKGVVRPKTPAELKEEARAKLRNKLAATHAPRYCLYNLRHSWLDRALKAGVDALTCAILMGHRDPSTISKVYQHLSQSPDFLRAAAEKAAR